MKRIMSLFIAFCFLFNFSSLAVGAAEVGSSATESVISRSDISVADTVDLNEQVQSDLDALKEISFTVDYNCLQIQDVNDQGKVTYEYQMPAGKTALIEVETGTDGCVNVDIREGNKHNLLSVKENEIYLNGGKVVISPHYNAYNNEMSALRASVPYVMYSGKPQYDGPYSNYINTFVENEISAPDTSWKLITTPALAFLISQALVPFLHVTGIELASTLVEELTNLANTLLEEGAPKPDTPVSMSFTVDLYESDKALAWQKQWKWVGKYYTDTHLRGDYVNYTFYEGYYFFP